MLSKSFHYLLLLTIAIGVGMTIQAQLRVRPLKAEYARLVSQYQELEIVDPTQYKIVRITDSEPRLYRWRFYRPENVNLQAEVTCGLDDNLEPHTSTSGAFSAGEELLSLNVVFNGPEIHFLVYGPLFSGWTVSDPENGKLLQTHWDELKIELAASSGANEFGDDEVLTLVEITAPEQFADGTRLKTAENGRCLRIRLGDERAFGSQKPKGQP